MQKYQLNSLDYVINRFFMKLFKTSNIRIVQLCQELFHFELPSVQLARRRKLFLDSFAFACKVKFFFVIFLCFLSSTMLLVNKDLQSELECLICVVKSVSSQLQQTTLRSASNQQSITHILFFALAIAPHLSVSNAEPK